MKKALEMGFSLTLIDAAARGKVPGINAQICYFMRMRENHDWGNRFGRWEGFRMS